MSAFFELHREYDSEIAILNIKNNICQPHFHSNIELAYVVDGFISININGQIQTLTKGCMSIANSYDIHSYTNIENSDIIVVIIPIELVNSYTAMLRSKVFSTPFIEGCEQTGQIHSMILKLVSSESPGHELINKGCAYTILGLILNRVALVDKPSASGTDLARKILLYMQQNYLNPLSIDSLAKHFGYNRDYLSRFFNSFLGCGFNSYLNALRTRHAAYLMSNGKADLTEISFASGFDNYRTFNRAFKNFYGMTPSDFKKSK